MIDKPTFVRNLSNLLISSSEPRSRILDKVIRSKTLSKFMLNNRDVAEKLESKRSVPIERIRFLASDIYNMMTDKRR